VYRREGQNTTKGTRGNVKGLRGVYPGNRRVDSPARRYGLWEEIRNCGVQRAEGTFVDWKRDLKDQERKSTKTGGEHWGKTRATGTTFLSYGSLLSRGGTRSGTRVKGWRINMITLVKSEGGGGMDWYVDGDQSMKWTSYRKGEKKTWYKHYC